MSAPTLLISFTKSNYNTFVMDVNSNIDESDIFHEKYAYREYFRESRRNNFITLSKINHKLILHIRRGGVKLRV